MFIKNIIYCVCVFVFKAFSIYHGMEGTSIFWWQIKFLLYAEIINKKKKKKVK